MRRPTFPRISRQLCFAVLSATCWVGCAERAEVSHYVVPKHSTIQIEGDGQPEGTHASDGMATTVQPTGAPSHRMLAVVIRHGGQAWFLKGMATTDQMADGVREKFVQLVKSIEFSADSGQPSWTLPEGWREEAASGMRLANLYAGSVEFSVIPLPFPGGDEQRYLLSNIVRWRGQLRLPTISEDQLVSETEEIELSDGSHATFVDLSGWEGANDMRPPFASGNGNLPPSHPPIGAIPQMQGFAPQGSASLTYDLPDGWQELKAGGMRRAAFQVSDGDQKAEVTVIDLAGSAGDLLSNVNRWRDQIGLGALRSTSAIDSTNISVDDKPGTYLHLEGTEGRAIWAVVIPDEGRVWFVKLTGDLPLAQREESAFRSLVESIRFGG